MLMYAWAQFDGAGAIKYAGDETDRPRACRLVSSAGPPSQAGPPKIPPRLWSGSTKKFVRMPLREARKLKDGEPLKPEADYAAALIKGWTTTDPYAASEYLIDRFGPGKERETLVGHIASSLIKESTQAAVEWAESFDNQQFKEEAFEELAEDWSSIDPAATGAWLAKHINEGYSKEAVEDLARGWGRQRPGRCGRLVRNPR